jgi:hypothetical protein
VAQLGFGLRRVPQVRELQRLGVLPASGARPLALPCLLGRDAAVTDPRLRLELSPWSWRPTDAAEAEAVLRASRHPDDDRAVLVTVRELDVQVELPLDRDGSAAAAALADGRDPLGAAQAGPAYRDRLVEFKLERDRRVRHLRLPDGVREGVLAELEQIARRRALTGD